MTEKMPYEVLQETLAEVRKENIELKIELKRIYEVATVNKITEILDEFYSELLEDNSDEASIQRQTILKCMEKIDSFGDDLK